MKLVNINDTKPTNDDLDLGHVRAEIEFSGGRVQRVTLRDYYSSSRVCAVITGNNPTYPICVLVPEPEAKPEPEPASDRAPATEDATLSAAIS